MLTQRISRLAAAVLLLGVLALLSTPAWAAGAEGLKRVRQELVAPPFLPQHEQVAKGSPVVVQVRLEVQEKQMEVSPGVFTQAMTFNGSVPGPIIVVHQDDYVELTLVNPASNTLPHNIDFHAATGAMGGGTLTKVGPGQQAVLRFKATKAGVFVYHCAPGGTMVPWHVVSGMNGAIMVLPRNGLSDQNGKPVRYDRAYYIGEQDFYLPKDASGAFKHYASPVAGMVDTMQAMKTLVPSFLVFNGAVGALTGEHAMKAAVGEKVLIIHSQANRDTRPHLIGGHADLFWNGGSFTGRPMTNRETWFIPGGAAAAMLYEFKQPGTYAYLNHNLIEAFMFGAVAMFDVSGKWNDDLMTQVAAPAPIP